MAVGIEADDRDCEFVIHSHDEQLVDVGEVRMNYIRAGSPHSPALLLLPGQTSSWWDYEAAIALLEGSFEVFAVDLRGQGRSTWTPGRYTLDNVGNDLVRFIDRVIGRPAVVSGASSSGVIAAWLSAYSRPGQVRATICEDSPLFSGEISPACGPGLRQTVVDAIFESHARWLGPQWSVGDWKRASDAIAQAFPREVAHDAAFTLDSAGSSDHVPQNMVEYDPEWARAYRTGSASAACDHRHMLASAHAPMLYTHHFRRTYPPSGLFLGAATEEQVEFTGQLITDQGGQRFDYISLPDAHHSLHAAEPQQYVDILTTWLTEIS